MTLRLRIPLRQNDNRITLSAPLFWLGGEKSGSCGIVLDGRSFDCTGPSQLIAVEFVVMNVWKCIELTTRLHHMRRVVSQHIPRIMPVDVIYYEFKSPFERAYQTIIVSLVIPALSPVHITLPKTHLKFSNPPGKGEMLG